MHWFVFTVGFFLLAPLILLHDTGCGLPQSNAIYSQSAR